MRNLFNIHSCPLLSLFDVHTEIAPRDDKKAEEEQVIVINKSREYFFLWK